MYGVLAYVLAPALRSLACRGIDWPSGSEHQTRSRYLRDVSSQGGSRKRSSGDCEGPSYQRKTKPTFNAGHAPERSEKGLVKFCPQTHHEAQAFSHMALGSWVPVHKLDSFLCYFTLLHLDLRSARFMEKSTCIRTFPSQPGSAPSVCPPCP